MGLMTSGRVGVFEVIIDDVPESLHSLTGIIASHRGSILNIVHERFTGNLPIGKTRVAFIMDTRSKEHLEKMFSDIVDKGFAVRKRTEN
jgi:threonine dehydratase